MNPAWVVIAAGISAAAHIGKLPPALPVLQASMGVTLMQAGFLLSLVQLAGMSLGLAVGLSADSMGLKRSVLIGLLVLAVASALGGWAQDVSVLMLLRGLEGFGFLLVCLPAPGLIRQLVKPQHMSLMMGFWGTYMPLGTASALMLGPWVIRAFGWQAWWWDMAAVSLLMAMCVGCWVPSDASRQAAVSLPLQPVRWQQRLQLTLSRPGPWLVALCFGLYSGQWLSIIGFLPTIYAQAGWSSASTASLTALVAGINMVGNAVSGRLLQRGVLPHRLLIAGFSVMGLCAVVAFAPWSLMEEHARWNPMLRFSSVLLFSMVGGVIPGTLFSLAVKVAPDEGTVSTTVGWMQQWSAFGQFVGPPLVAWVAMVTGGWSWTWSVTGAFALGGVVLALQLNRLLRSAPD